MTTVSEGMVAGIKKRGKRKLKLLDVKQFEVSYEDSGSKPGDMSVDGVVVVVVVAGTCQTENTRR